MLQQEGQSPKFTGSRLLVGAASMVIVGAGLVTMRSILAPFLFALLVAMAGTLPLQWLQSKRVPGPLAAVIVAGSVGLLLGLFGFVVTESVQGLTAALPQYRIELEELFNSVGAYLRPHGIELPALMKQVDEGVVMGIMGNVLQGFARSFSSMATAMVILIFVLLEATDYRIKLRVALSHTMDVNRLEKVVGDVQRYLFVKTITSSLTGILVGILCWLVGVDFPILWGLTAFVLNYIPVVGSIIASVPALFLAAIHLSLFKLLVLALGYVLVNTGVSNFLEPTLLGRHLGLSPLVVFMSLVFWGWAWGPIGMFLSVPITMLVKIFLENSDDLRWMAILMGSARGLKRELGEMEELDKKALSSTNEEPAACRASAG